MHLLMSKPFVKNTLWKFSFLSFVLVIGFSIMVEHDLFVHELLVVLTVQVVKFEVEIESLNLISDWFILFEMEVLQIRVVQCIFHCYSFCRIEL